jgi:membrane protease YdiL (CAAX protease family)
MTSFRNTALLSGGIWALWHMPLMILANYHGEGTPLAYSLACFAAMIVGLSFVMAWITLKSGSFWPAALLHATHNLFVQGVFDSATVETSQTNWWTSEFGAGLAIALAVAAIVLIRFVDGKKSDVRSPAEGSAAAGD